MILRRLGVAGEGKLLASGFVVLLAMSLVSILFTRVSNEITDEITTSLNIVNTLANFRADMRRTESSQRSYLLGQEPRYRADYEATRNLVMPALDELEDGSARNRRSSAGSPPSGR